MLFYVYSVTDNTNYTRITRDTCVLKYYHIRFEFYESLYLYRFVNIQTHNSNLKTARTRSIMEVMRQALVQLAKEIEELKFKNIETEHSNNVDRMEFKRL